MDFLNMSFRVVRLFEITVRVHIIFLIWIAFRMLQAGDDWMYSLIFLGMLFGTVLLHEFGHCFGARSVGGDAENILMWPLGGLAYANAPMTPWAQFVTVASGPLVNVAFCLITGVIIVGMTGTLSVLSLNPFNSIVFGAFPAGTPSWVVYLSIFYSVNYFMLAFNLLPIYPLDGGQLFQCLLWPFMGLHQAMTIACQVGLVGCIGFGLWGLGEGGGMLVFIALFGGFTCWQRLKMLKYGMIAEEQMRYAPYQQYNVEERGFFARIFKLKRRSKPRVARDVYEEPEADDWRREKKAQTDRESELDRILKKVHEQGMNSLSYIERQRLAKATRERQKRDRELQGKK